MFNLFKKVLKVEEKREDYAPRVKYFSQNNGVFDGAFSGFRVTDLNNVTIDDDTSAKRKHELTSLILAAIKKMRNEGFIKTTSYIEYNCNYGLNYSEWYNFLKEKGYNQFKIETEEYTLHIKYILGDSDNNASIAYLIACCFVFPDKKIKIFSNDVEIKLALKNIINDVFYRENGELRRNLNLLVEKYKKESVS